LKKVIVGLEEAIAIKTQEAEHMTTLVNKMESSPGQDEQQKVQIADLKVELAKAEETIKIRNDELLQNKKDLKLKDETIQQREIDISCLRGQVIDVDNADIKDEDDDDDTLTWNYSDVDEHDILLDDLELEWDPLDVTIKLEHVE
jgi:hypothetical protein